ncbi:MAG: hypothetical protein KatS3mg094_152 [Candidatus Parcubacteria bacterium]|nr:MAG: hypothetical protein KatS3mg094_152 [Candidatus Parcubacteria bacterium]
MANTANIYKLKDKVSEEDEIIYDLFTAGGNGLFLLIWIITAALKEWQSLIISLWAIIFAVGAFLLFRLTKKREPFYVYAGVAVMLLAAATATELQGATLIIAYTIESALIPLITYLVLRDINVAQRLSLLLIAPVLLSFKSIDSYSWSLGVIHKDFFVLLILGLALLALVDFFRDILRKAEISCQNKLMYYY